jgi:Transposase DDE domain/DDE_Tnp_1-associated
MLAAVVCAVLSGARGYSAISQWLHAQEPVFWHALGFWRKPPKLGAFRKLLIRLCPIQFEAAIRQWVATHAGRSEAELEAVAIDGKSLCGTLQPHARAVHLISLFDQASGCVLSQQQVDPSTNEAKAALELLKTIVLGGRVVTGDAMYCQREVCQQILDEGGHYLIAVKDNQPELKEAVAADLTAAFSPGSRSAAAIAP